MLRWTLLVVPTLVVAATLLGARFADRPMVVALLAGAVAFVAAASLARISEQRLRDTPSASWRR